MLAKFDPVLAEIFGKIDYVVFCRLVAKVTETPGVIYGVSELTLSNLHKM